MEREDSPVPIDIFRVRVSSLVKSGGILEVIKSSLEEMNMGTTKKIFEISSVSLFSVIFLWADKETKKRQ